MAAVLFDEMLTDTPLSGAGLVSVTVPTEGTGPITDVGLSDTLAICAGPGGAAVIVKTADAELLDVAVMFAVCVDDTSEVVTANVPLV